MKYALGVDIGGTNIRIAIVDENGNIIDVIKEKTCEVKSYDDLAKQIESLYNKVKGKYHYEGIGFGIPGPVKKDGTVLYLTNLNLIYDCNFNELLKDKIDIPMYFGNDASVAGLAEATVGNGKGYDIVQYLTLSTGIGGSLIINGKMIEGKNGMAQEVGAMIIDSSSTIVQSNKPEGSIEAIASGTAITNKALDRNLKVNHAGDVFELSKTNKIAKEIKDNFIKDMGAFINSIYCYIEPDIFVLGGGMMKSKEYFLDDLISYVNDKYMPDTLKNTDAMKIVCAKYDQDCGIIGAAMQCFNN